MMTEGLQQYATTTAATPDSSVLPSLANTSYNGSADSLDDIQIQLYQRATSDNMSQHYEMVPKKLFSTLATHLPHPLSTEHHDPPTLIAPKFHNMVDPPATEVSSSLGPVVLTAPHTSTTLLYPRPSLDNEMASISLGSLVSSAAVSPGNTTILESISEEEEKTESTDYGGVRHSSNSYYEEFTSDFMHSKSTEDPNQQEDVPIEPSCHGGLNLSPQQLAQVFALFDLRQQPSWPFGSSSTNAGTTAVVNPNNHLDSYSQSGTATTRHSSVLSEVENDAATTVTSNTSPSNSADGQHSAWSSSRVYALERECKALKDIIKADSTNIRQLKATMEGLRVENTRQLTDMKGLQLELDMLKREKELQAEREMQHQETIKTLKAELDALTDSRSPANVSMAEMEQLKVENELFAAQIVDTEVEMRTIQATLHILQQDNEELHTELQLLRSRVSGSAGSSHGQPSPGGHSTTSWISNDVGVQLQALAARLDSIESERGRRDPPTGKESPKKSPATSSLNAAPPRSASPPPPPPPFLHAASSAAQVKPAVMDLSDEWDVETVLTHDKADENGAEPTEAASEVPAPEAPTQIREEAVEVELEGPLDQTGLENRRMRSNRDGGSNGHQKRRGGGSWCGCLLTSSTSSTQDT